MLEVKRLAIDLDQQENTGSGENMDSYGLI